MFWDSNLFLALTILIAIWIATSRYEDAVGRFANWLKHQLTIKRDLPKVWGFLTVVLAPTFFLIKFLAYFWLIIAFVHFLRKIIS